VGSSLNGSLKIARLCMLKARAVHVVKKQPRDGGTSLVLTRVPRCRSPGVTAPTPTWCKLCGLPDSGDSTSVNV
jgi:hypothetical protein